MNVQALTLALTALALLSTTTANAQSRYTYTVNGSNVLTNSAVVGGTNVTTYPAVVAGPSALSACPTTIDACAPLFGEQTHFDNDMNINRGLIGGLFGSGGTRRGVSTYSAVVPNQCGLAPAARACGQQFANELFSLRLFGFGFGFGKVNPDLDMRPLGHAN
jgi:hypothetical protein